MTGKMNDLALALTDAGVNISPNLHGSDTIFAGQYGIFCTITGNVQARSVFDSDERFTLGKVSDSVESLVKSFLAGDPG